ncbi:hypothetical protein Saro_3204 [Novosphingobium aromaticivorans DSM 12444]|uniref:Uncharacterized protein n=1 Tax=Novosphingobium aromaticivorans (strain ATCC 700278 / DSM 12444 / CCUG 56034 / CIP 105152 / NBRC 16084 / F199) TaxID=279238 RepID=Q2G3D4_NOVAD|nr:hypothetical protein [Novosphingobium aromaticivorans]ABD27639.1 hypothetical protein Saro_3204 [Novosphingobium aromaticivorans DSM 12444]SCY31808.1 hypothetical protein SAMN05660666_01407 [Novosphingobium aromaticivorans]
MTFDLGKALLRKEEYESARLTEFDFAEMVRALKALAGELGADVEPMLGILAENGLASALLHLRAIAQRDVGADYLRCRAVARAKLIEERGDPSPVRLG